MGLDVHVMPLWKFWAGDYVSPVERLAPEKYVRVGGAKALYVPDMAKHKVRLLQTQILHSTLAEVPWPDDGEVAFSHQFSMQALHAVQAYAAYLQYPPTNLHKPLPFDLKGEYPSPDAFLKGRPTKYRHLIAHQDERGIYVPLDFEKPVILREDPYSVGSTNKLVVELAEIRSTIADCPEWGDPVDEPDESLALVKYGVPFLYECAWASLQHELPIVFDG